MTHHQCGIPALLAKTSFRGETSGGVEKSRLFSQAKGIYEFLTTFHALLKIQKFSRLSKYHGMRHLCNLHGTAMFTVSTALPHSLLASHLYSPAWLLLIFVSCSKLPFVRCPLLTFTQETKGKGTPVAMQVKFKLSVSLTVLSGIDEIFGGTAIKQRKRKRKIEGVGLLSRNNQTFNDLTI